MLSINSGNTETQNNDTSTWDYKIETKTVKQCIDAVNAWEKHGDEKCYKYSKKN